MSIRFLQLLFLISPFLMSSQESEPTFKSGSRVEHLSSSQLIESFYIAEKQKSTQLEIALGNRENWILQLESMAMGTKERMLQIIGPQGSLASQHGVSRYRGSIQGMEGSTVRLVRSEHHVFASINVEDEQYIIEKNASPTKSKDDLNFYNVEDLSSAKPLQCMHDLSSNIEQEVDKKVREIRSTKSLECVSIDLAYAADYSIYLDAGESNDAVVSYLYALTDLIEANYASFNIEFRISAISISVCSDCDPWSNTNLITELLPEFKTWALNGGISSDYDIGGLWTTRSWEVPAAGLAYVDEFCDKRPFYVGTKFSSNIPFVAAMATHEIGHIFGCRHNYETGGTCDGGLDRAPLFMDPYISPETTDWSDVAISCQLNSSETIMNTLSSTDCHSDCNVPACDPITAITQTNNTDGVQFNWEGTSPEYRVIIRALTDDTEIINRVISETTFATDVLTQCETYQVTINAVCANNAEGVSQTMLINASYDSKLFLLSANVVDCTPGIDGGYDAEFIVQHQGGSTGGFEIDLGGQKEQFPYEQTSDNIQIVKMTGLVNDGNINTPLTISAYPSSATACNVYTSFPAPNEACDITTRESFDFCNLPYQWSNETTNTSTNTDPYEWKFGGSDRPILNYGGGANAESDLTMNGSCMAYFDDDRVNNSAYTGQITLTSQVFDLSNSDASSMTFSYNFHNFSDGKPANGSFFHVELFDGDEWTVVHEDAESNCPWFDVWDCFETVTIDLNLYAHENLQMRFVYSDGGAGDWTGMVALDDFMVETAFSTVLPLDMVSLQGEIMEDYNLIEWSTLNEVNLDKFILERASEDLQFQEIASVQAHNEYDNRYEIIDADPITGQSLYRLKINDRDGISTYSETFSLEREEIQLQTEVYPNPISDGYLNYAMDEEVRTITIWDLNGRMIARETPNSKKGSIDVSALNGGTYILKMNGENRQDQQRFIKL